MLPAEQPARTMAPAASAAARARLGAGRCERDINIMPIRSRPDCNVNTPAGPLPLRGKIAANSSNWEQAVFLQYDQSKVKAEGFTGDARPRPRADSQRRPMMRLAAVMSKVHLRSRKAKAGLCRNPN